VRSESCEGCEARWIGRDGVCLIDWRAQPLPAPLFRHEVELSGNVRQARLRLCGLGFHELRINGEKVGDHVLDPIVTQYDRRVRYVTHEVARHLRRGRNALGVMLGNGWYNCSTAEVWHFNKASWRDYPKLWLLLEIVLETGQTVTVASGPEWRVGEGPVRFDALRNGETYDAREERPGWDSPGYDDSGWSRALVVPGPGGLMEPQSTPPCKVMETLSPRAVHEIRPGVAVFDLGQNIAGWAQLRVEPCESGREIVLRYGERLKANGEVDQSHIGTFIRSGECQTDRYIAKGGGVTEVWEPRFTYHGFQYVQVEGLPGTPSLDTLRGRVVHTAFESVGEFAASDPDLNALQRATRWSYIGNFVGIPTDCPHREKNGWTGDAQLAVETGLLNFASASSYGQWLDTMADSQRPNGQLTCIVPSAGWGFNWGNGPAWDAAFVLIPWYLYLYTGERGSIERHYAAIRRYVDFCATLSTEHIVSYGLGDWCPVDEKRMAPAALTSSAYYCVFARTLAAYARLTGHEGDAERYAALSEQIRRAVNARFYKGDGLYAEGQMTALGCALNQGLVEQAERPAVLRRLVETVEANGCKVDFGILGAKYVPRALADNGHAELAYRLIAQPDFPGWVHWLRQGATTLWESWNDANSRNHIMFGDISAWFFTYLAGIRPDPQRPGFEHVIVQPNVVSALEWVRASHRAPRGLIACSWRRCTAASVEFEIELPESVSGTLLLAGSAPRSLGPGKTVIQQPLEGART
jgi:alpha-L-rhamnosidase